MLNRHEAILKKIDPDFEETGGFNEETAVERPRAFRFHFIEICGGAGKVAAALSAKGWTVGPVLDIDRSPHYDLASLRLLQWIFFMLEDGRLDSFMVEPPCTTFSPAQYPPSRSYDLPRGFDPQEPKTLQGTTLALRALSLMSLAAQLAIPGLLEQPRRSKMKKLEEWQRLLEFGWAHEVWTASCMYGSPHRKEFVFLLVAMQAEQLHRKCDGCHEHIPIQGQWTKPSATYTDELAEALAEAFHQALNDRLRSEKDRDLQVDGLENILVNDVILSRTWDLEQVWRWQKPAHINIQETMAAERLFKQEAVLRPKTRFPLIMDSNVSLSALVKGRSPSKGLRKSLRRVGATLIAGCLYPSLHFGPTRILPADHPTRDHDLPDPCESCVPKPCPFADLLDFSRIRTLRRFASNWLRLFLLLLETVPPWINDKDAWRYGHVNFRSFSAHRRFHGYLEFDQTLVFPGEGPGFGPFSCRPWALACLVFPCTVILSSALLTAAILFGLCCSLGLLALAQKKGRPATASRFRLHPCVPGPFGFPRKGVWVLLGIWLALPHVDAAPHVSHGMHLIPRNQADKVRAQGRDNLELPKGRPVLPATQKQRDRLLEDFSSWLGSQGVSFEELVMVLDPDIEMVNMMLERFGRELYKAGRPYGHYSELINGVAGKRPRIRRSLQPAWDLAYTWLRQEPPSHHLALPWQALMSLLSTSLMWGWSKVAGVIALSWGGITRIGEALSACRRDLVLPQDVEWTTNYALLQIAEPKTRYKAARHQVARLDQPQLLQVVTLAFGHLRPDQKLWPDNEAEVPKAPGGKLLG